MKALQKLLLLSALLLSSLTLNAQVTYYGVEKTQFYSQTANNTAPSTPYQYSVYAFVDTTAPTDESSYTVTDGASTINLAPKSSSSTLPGTPSFGGNNYYTTLSDMNTAFASGDNYTFTGTGGTLGTQTQTLPVRPDDYPQELYVTDTGITDAQGLNPTTGYTFNVAYTGSGVSTSTALAILDPAGNFIYDVNGTADQDSFSLSSTFLETLSPGEEYRVEIVDFNAVGFVVAGDFGTSAKNTDAFGQSTTFNLMVVPEPSTWVMLLCGLGLLIFVKTKEARIWSRVIPRN